ncbi:helix-turn-helix transcriptional regulator [Acidobacteriota bacterium]
MKSLTRKEELLILTILNLKKNAYLIAITDHLTKVTGKKVSLTSVHAPLSRLEKYGVIKGENGEATAVRGGRRKKIYSVTKLGHEMLENYKKITDTLWANHLKFSNPKD